MKTGSIILLENLRFHPGEEQNDMDFSRELAKLADIYINDAFGASHRYHASISKVPNLMPIKVAGYLLEKEIHYLGQKTDTPQRPYVVILGGAKVSDKIKIINSDNKITNINQDLKILIEKKDYQFQIIEYL